MNLQERLVLCKQCKKKKFSQEGIICSITAQKPAFENSFENFEIDPQEAQKIAAQSRYVQEEESSGKSIWIYIGIALVLLRIILRFFRD